jgi:CHAD domain-containing protein
MPEKNSDFPLLQYLDELVEELRDLAPKAVKDSDNDDVHDARVGTRRLKAAIDLLQPVLSKRHWKPFQKATRGLRKRLGPVRDADVMLEHLKEIKSSVHEAATAWMKDRLEKTRQDVAEKAADDLPPAEIMAQLGSWWGLRQEIIQAEEAAASLLSESVHLQLDAFAEQADQMLAKVKGHDPHQVRIAGKSLRYTLEMGVANKAKLPKTILAGFKRIQTALGLWHDYVVLTACIMEESAAEEVALHDLEQQRRLLKLADFTLRRAGQQLAKVGEIWKSSGPEWLDQIRHAFPLTESVKVDAPTPEPQLSGQA